MKYGWCDCDYGSYEYMLKNLFNQNLIMAERQAKELFAVIKYYKFPIFDV